MSVIEHHIQREILDKLTRAASLRFAELKPDGLESNIFTYHLRQLQQAGYIEKDSTQYRLAAKGLSYVDGLSGINHKPRPQPKLIAIVALHDGAGKWLLAERKIQPYIGTLMFPSGKQHRGETSSQHAARELFEKTGFSDVPLRLRGTADVQITNAEGVLLTHVMAMVYDGQVDGTALPPETDRFRYEWVNFADTSKPLMSGTRELYEYVAQPGSFAAEIIAAT